MLRLTLSANLISQLLDETVVKQQPLPGPFHKYLVSSLANVVIPVINQRETTGQWAVQDHCTALHCIALRLRDDITFHRISPWAASV